MSKILGVDPGSRTTGYAVIERCGRKWVHIDNGIINPSARLAMAERLFVIYQGLVSIVSRHHPEAMALENIFLDENPQTAIKLGQARGMAMLVSAQYGLSLAEYTPLSVKQTVSGYGRASKEQVQEMVKRHFDLPEVPCEDASDALAVAYTHALSGSSRLSVGQSRKPASWRMLKAV